MTTYVFQTIAKCTWNALKRLPSDRCKSKNLQPLVARYGFLVDAREAEREAANTGIPERSQDGGSRERKLTVPADRFAEKKGAGGV